MRENWGGVEIQISQEYKSNKQQVVAPVDQDICVTCGKCYMDWTGAHDFASVALDVRQVANELSGWPIKRKSPGQRSPISLSYCCCCCCCRCLHGLLCIVPAKDRPGKPPETSQIDRRFHWDNIYYKIRWWSEAILRWALQKVLASLLIFNWAIGEVWSWDPSHLQSAFFMAVPDGHNWVG